MTTKKRGLKHGKWEQFSSITFKCSLCGYRAPDWKVDEFHFCPNCGAAMDEPNAYTFKAEDVGHPGPGSSGTLID